MSQAPFPSASLLSEGLLEQQLKSKHNYDGPADHESTQNAVQLKPTVDIKPSLPHSKTEAITANETPHTVVDTNDDARTMSLDITSETKLPQSPSSTDDGTPKPIDIPTPRQSQNDEWIIEGSGDTDDETLNWLEQELEKQKLGNGTSTSTKISLLKQKHSTWPLRAGEEDKPRQKLTTSRLDDRVVVHRGFGNFLISPQPATPEDKRTSFPPLSNAYYDLTTYGLDPKVHKKPPKTIVVDESGAPADRKSQNCELQTLDGNLSDPLSAQSNGVVTEPVVRSDKATETVVSSDNLEFCTKCQKRHIKQGPLSTLDDRDTCRSMLPDWFPKERFDKPWEAFTDLINRYVRAGQMLEGIEENPESRTPWNMEYHEPSDEWKEAGRFGGWWKCRIEDERGESEVLSVEKNCPVCLRQKIENDRLLVKRTESLAEKKQAMEDWIGKRMKQEMVKDRAYVKARLATEGF